MDAKVEDATAQVRRARPSGLAVFYGRNLALCRGVLSLLAGFLLWEWVARYVVKSTLIIVPPSQVVESFVELVSKGELQTHVYVTGFEFILGFGLAAVLGVGFGIAIGVSNAVRDVLDPWLSALYATPVVAFAPLFVVWMGIGPSSKVAVAFLLAVLPIIINTSAGIRTTDQNLVDVARSFAARRSQVFRKILIPYALPFIIAGLRLGVGRAIIGVVVAEFFGTRAGLGYMILVSSQLFDTSALFVAVVILAGAGILSVIVLQKVERWLAPWREDAVRT
jgi:ABC-type nitrate/sulfonate/bicarbonate transport system permease component